jgi:hypothetical protein
MGKVLELYKFEDHIKECDFQFRKLEERIDSVDRQLSRMEELLLDIKASIRPTGQ